MPNSNTIQLIEGEQWWYLYCSDKFGLSADEVISDSVHGLGVALRAILSQAKGQTGDLSPWQELGTGSNTYRIGNARPIEVLSVSKSMPAKPAGTVLADRNSYPGDGIPTVVGQQPWHVAIHLWWRAPDEPLPWPAFTSLLPALPDLEQVNGADWVLAMAVKPAKQDADPGDASWASTQGTRIVETAKTVGSGIMSTVVTIGAAALAVAIFIATVKQKKH